MSSQGNLKTLRNLSAALFVLLYDLPSQLAKCSVFLYCIFIQYRGIKLEQWPSHFPNFFRVSYFQSLITVGV